MTPTTILNSVFGFSGFRPGQEEVVNHIANGQNILAVMPTGAGKSLCYQVPALLFERPTMVVSPLVALMDNQVAGLRMNGVNVACIHSGQDRDENIKQWRSVTHGDTKILYMSPERLMSERMLAAMYKLQPAMFVVDEAHCISKWGPAFRPEYADLENLRQYFPNSIISAFTATADAATRKDIAERLLGGSGKTIVQGFDRPNISLGVLQANNRKKQILNLVKGREGQSGIIYCLSRKNTEEFAAHLQSAGFKALPYHAGLSNEERFNSQERFQAEDGIIMVATVAFGMGIDKPDIRFVYHTNLPGSLEAYYQEIGRASRDGAPADTVMIYGLDDLRLRQQFITQESDDTDHIIREMKRLDALMAFCEASSCRRQILLYYFGETQPPCGNCDNCLNPPELVDMTEAAKNVLEAIKQTGERFGQAHIVGVSRGEETDRIKQFSHHNLSAFGANKAIAKPYLLALIRQMIGGGLLRMDITRFGTLSVTGSGDAVLNGQERFECKSLRQTKRGSNTTKSAQRNALAKDLNEDERDLLMLLKALRSDLARELGKPAYVVFSDATLIDMVEKLPANETDMLKVNGVGQTKFERYGDIFLKAIRDN